MAWVQIALALLKMVNAILDYTRDARVRQEGVDEEIARETAKILQKTEFAKKVLAEFTSSAGSADEFLRKLEPK